MEEDYSKSEKLNKLEKKLYSRNKPNIIDTGRTELNPKTGDESGVGGWQNVKNNTFDELASKMAHVAQKKHGFLRKMVMLSGIFFVLACAFAAFIFFGGINTVSSKNVDIKVDGPLSIGAGTEVSFGINIINNNNIDLQSASLLLEYPEGTRSAIDVTKTLERERFPLETIKSGKSFVQNAKAVFFGEKDTIKQVKISLEYRVENSSALFYKEKTYDMSISSAPVIITPTYPKEVNSNQDISFNIEVASNSKEKLNDILVNVEYPFGFTFKSATPAPSFNTNVWKFSTLNASDRKTISIRGSIVGQDNEERVFRINAGHASKDDERVISVPLSELTESITVKKPFVSLGVSVDGKNGDVAVAPGSQAKADIDVRNNLSTGLFNVSVEAALSGGALNPLGVSADSGGFFQSFNNTILWDKRTVPDFDEMAPGEEEQISFVLSPLLYANIKPGSKPEIDMVVTVRGEYVLESGSSEQVVMVEKRKVVLATDISLSSKIVRSLGNIENSGPMPPKVNMPTTYTVMWSISNSFNQVSNVSVKATLPAYVKWTGIKDPSSENISFNSFTNEVVWNVGSILPNTGFNSPGKKASFQIEFLPSSSQIGQSPYLVGEAALSGIDKVTGVKINSSAPALNTNWSGDQSFKSGDERVVQ